MHDQQQRQRWGPAIDQIKPFALPLIRSEQVAQGRASNSGSVRAQLPARLGPGGTPDMHRDAATSRPNNNPEAILWPEVACRAARSHRDMKMHDTSACHLQEQQYSKINEQKFRKCPRLMSASAASATAAVRYVVSLSKTSKRDLLRKCA